MHTILIVLALYLGAKARGVACAEIAVACVAVLVCARMIWKNRIRPARFRADVARQVLRRGSAFVLWGSILALQPSLEAVLLSKLASPDVVGWFGALVETAFDPSAAWLSLSRPKKKTANIIPTKRVAERVRKTGRPRFPG